jgi:hypothetical protein
VRTRVESSDIYNVAPTLVIAWDHEVLGITPAAVLCAPANTPQEKAPDPTVDLTGGWTVHIRYPLGESLHAVALVQEGAHLYGEYGTPYARVEAKGFVQGNAVEWRVMLGDETSPTPYIFTGRAQGDTMQGTVTLGEFGRGTWSARRAK